MGTDLNIGVVKVPPYARFVQRRADIEKPHLKVEHEAFQNRYKLANVASFHILKKWETAKISISNLTDFVL